MAEGLEHLPERVEAVEQKLEGLAAGFAAHVDQVSLRFDQVDAALLEQRRYTEFAYSRQDSKMDAGFAQVEARFSQVEVRFSQMDARFSQMDARFSQMDARFARLERKLDQFIDGHFSSRRRQNKSGRSRK